MKLSTADLRTDRHWRSATGLDQKRFGKLLALLPTAYRQVYGQSIQQRQQQCPEIRALNTYEELLLFTLFSIKSGLSFDLLGFTMGMDGFSSKRNQDIGLLVIKMALNQSGHLPKKQFEDAESFKAYFKDKGDVLIDATEQRTQRPEDDTYQKQLYSGKKKPIPHRRTDAIGGLKQYRYLSDRLRTHKVSLYESALLVCAGIWNFYLTN